MILLLADLVQAGVAEWTAGTAVAAAEGAMIEAVEDEVTVTAVVEGVTTGAVVTEAVETGTAAVEGVTTEVAVTETVAAETIRIVGDLVVAGRKGAVYERENRKVRTLSSGCGKSVSADIFEYLLP